MVLVKLMLRVSPKLPTAQLVLGENGCHIDGTQVCQAGGGLFVLHADIKLLYNDILDKKGDNTDQRTLLDRGIGGNIRIQKFVIDIIAHIVMDMDDDFFKGVVAHARVYRRVHHGNKVPQCV